LWGYKIGEDKSDEWGRFICGRDYGLGVMEFVIE
jgi:hypothetical protein